MYDFLGSVNLFQGRVDHGRMKSGALEVAAPEHGALEDVPALACVRPHDMEVGRRQDPHRTIPATVRHVAPVGPVVRVELLPVGGGAPIEAELSRERYRELALAVGDRVFAGPRVLRLFLGAEAGQPSSA